MQKQHTLLDILNLCTEYLTKFGLADPRHDSQLLLAEYFKISRMDLYLRFDQPVSKHELNDIREMLKRRAKHEPLQYIFGKADFYGLEFKVNREVLIPRMDTETLIETVLAGIDEDRLDLKLLDIGTGTGCIPISVLKNSSSVEAIGMDISEGAVALARENAVINEVEERVTFFVRDLFKDMKVKEKFDIVVSNPPYIASSEMDELDLEVKDYEPHTALSDNGDGLKFYERIAAILSEILIPGGLLCLEIGYLQGESVQKIFANLLDEMVLIKDLSGKDRVIRGIMKR